MRHESLFTTYTFDFQYSIESYHLQKFTDGTAIVGCVENGGEHYRSISEWPTSKKECHSMKPHGVKSERMILSNYKLITCHCTTRKLLSGNIVATMSMHMAQKGVSRVAKYQLLIDMAVFRL